MEKIFIEGRISREKEKVFENLTNFIFICNICIMCSFYGFILCLLFLTGTKEANLLFQKIIIKLLI